MRTVVLYGLSYADGVSIVLFAGEASEESATRIQTIIGQNKYDGYRAQEWENGEVIWTGTGAYRTEPHNIHPRRRTRITSAEAENFRRIAEERNAE